MKKYLAYLRQWLSSDPCKPLDVHDYKAKEAFDLKFASFMDKTLAVRRGKNKRLAHTQQFIVEDDETDADETQDYVVSGQEDDFEDDEY